jgi:hypothetical protein
MSSDREDSPRIFTIEEANAMVPRLTDVVGQQIDLGEQIRALVGELWELSDPSSHDVEQLLPGVFDDAAVLDMSIRPEDSAAVKKLKRTLAECVQRYRAGWREVQSTGAVIKDTQLGLLDFYGRVDDRIVWLCWKYGEPTVDWYHELDTGFGARKSLRDVKKRMLN